jgi:hypothetical protein
MTEINKMLSQKLKGLVQFKSSRVCVCVGVGEWVEAAVETLLHIISITVDFHYPKYRRVMAIFVIFNTS